MNPLFEHLAFFDDREPHAGAMNMAIDETLLRQAGCPALRVYRWARPAVSFGYFEKWAPIRAEWPERELVRRWTGGGVVPHGEDWTYSLLIPSEVAFASHRAAEAYRLIHLALARVLGAHGISASVYNESSVKTSPACFQNPVRHDVGWNGKKIAGAAQRRTRAGLLHQGSVQTVRLPESFGASLAAALAARVESWQPEGFEAAASALAEEKYGSAAWLRRF